MRSGRVRAVAVALLHGTPPSSPRSLRQCGIYDRQSPSCGFDLFCTADRCPVVVGNGLVFRDDNPLTVEHAEALSPVVGALVDRALPGG
ncbi:hypothetical protein GS505_15645 [Rhodococcus hoagii]|uniref:Uncharacterized protein n=1 Tax=Rhodococcus hoagii TaxID=43767 RepID=A0AAE4ZI65_RHOHA|nr:hypothetical protein [Prescottella equi]